VEDFADGVGDGDGLIGFEETIDFAEGVAVEVETDEEVLFVFAAAHGGLEGGEAGRRVGPLVLIAPFPRLPPRRTERANCGGWGYGPFGAVFARHGRKATQGAGCGQSQEYSSSASFLRAAVPELIRFGSPGSVVHACGATVPRLGKADSNIRIPKLMLKFMHT